MARTKGKVTGTAEDGWAQLTVTANPTYALL